jgi:hypothetical protein
MANIVQFLSDNRIQMGAEEIFRPMAWGTRWSKLRIGMRIGINAQTSFNNGLFAVGVSQGNLGYGSSAPTDYFGGYWGGTTGPTPNTFAFTQGATVSFFTTQSGQITAVQRSGNQGGIGTIGASAANFAAGPNRSIYFCTITKGASYTITSTVPTNPSNAGDCSYATFLNMLDDDAGTSWTNYFAITTFSPTVPVGNSPQLMDTVTVYWNHSFPTIDISDLVVVRMA